MMKFAFTLLICCLSCLGLRAQETLKVQGTVTDFITQKPIFQANVSVKGVASASAETSQTGAFEIQVPSRYSVLVVAFPGYQSREVPLHGNTTVSVALVAAGIDVGESTVRLPYQTVNAKDLNGAYTVIDKGDKAIRYRDIDQMLQGTVAGLESNAYSGVPGEGSLFNLGGIRSLYTTNQPLLVVDGLPVTHPVFGESVARGNLYNYLSDINVKDIATITVLRDAAAAGLYGSRAANGAIVVTTREGTNGKTFLDVSMQQGVASRFKSMPVMNASEYLPYLSQKLYDQGLDAETIRQRYPFFSNTDQNTVEYWKYANNTDWQQQVTRKALQRDYYLNLRGGDGTSKYSLQVGYQDQQGVGKGVDASRMTSRFNLDFKLLQKLTAGTRIAFSRTNKSLMDQGFDERVNPLYLSLVKPPILGPFQQSAQGVSGPFLSQPDFDQLSNPLAVTRGVRNDVLNFWILGNIFAQYEFSSALRTRVRLGLDRRGLTEDRFTPANGIVAEHLDPRFNRTSEEQMMSRQAMTAEHTLTFDKQLNPENRLSLLGGYNVELGDYTTTYGHTIGATSDDFQALGDGQKLLIRGVDEQHRNLSGFANADYSFREKLLVKAGLRLDGSSRFGSDARAGIRLGGVPFAALPYAGLTWRVKAEPWLNGLTALDELNLRSSYGVTANQDIPVNARYSLYQSQFYTFRPGTVPAAVGNKAVQWETNYHYNAGLDLSLLKKALGLRLDYHHTRTTDLLVPRIMDGMSGSSFYWGNGGSIQNERLELGLNTLGHAGGLVWNLGFNIASYRNRVLALPGKRDITDGVNGYTSLARVGQAAGLIYGYRHLGVFATQAQAQAANLVNAKGIAYQAGDYHYADLNRDGIINQYDRQVIGDPNPDFYGGITSNLTYKNFELDAGFSYSYGNQVLNVLRAKLETGSGYENQSAAVLSRWRTEADQATVPNTRYGDAAGNRLPSSRYIEDGSYLKLRTLTLAYHLTRQMAFVRNAQLYVSAYNLFTLSRYLGWDPEVAIGQGVFARGYDFGNYPTPRMLMAGIKLGL